MRNIDQEQQFKEAVNAAWDIHRLGTYRHARQVTGLSTTVLFDMRSYGRIPSRGLVIQWAEHLGEEVNKWLRLAGYDPIPAKLIYETATTVNQIKEQVAQYLIEQKGMSLEEIQAMWEKLGEKQE